MNVSIVLHFPPPVAKTKLHFFFTFNIHWITYFPSSFYRNFEIHQFIVCFWPNLEQLQLKMLLRCKNKLLHRYICSMSRREQLPHQSHFWHKDRHKSLADWLVKFQRLYFSVVFPDNLHLLKLITSMSASTLFIKALINFTGQKL